MTWRPGFHITALDIFDLLMTRELQKQRQQTPMKTPKYSAILHIEIGRPKVGERRRHIATFNLGRTSGIEGVAMDSRAITAPSELSAAESESLTLAYEAWHIVYGAREEATLKRPFIADIGSLIEYLARCHAGATLQPQQANEAFENVIHGAAQAFLSLQRDRAYYHGFPVCHVFLYPASNPIT